MYKTILVHVDGSAGMPQRVALAARLALLHDAHLVGAAPTGLSAYVFPVGGFETGLPAVVFPIEELRAEADRALDEFEQVARRAGVDKIERRRVDDEAGAAISLQARYADLVVIGQNAPAERLPQLRADFPEHVLLNCARPVLVMPASGGAGQCGQRVALAWNGRVEAVRAVTSAIGLLRQASHVSLVVLNPDQSADLHGASPGADMALYLSRHGVSVEVMVIESAQDDGEALLAHVAAQGCDLLVMGAYGHSRFREILLGGATRTVLRAARIPLWMAH